jgi:hypothetical protein
MAISIDIDEYGGISHHGKKVLVRSSDPKILQNCLADCTILIALREE